MVWILGIFYYMDQNVSGNLNKAIVWYTKVTSQGHAIAQYRLGTKYEVGHGVKQDAKIAVKWYIKAANQTHSKA